MSTTKEEVKDKEEVKEKAVKEKAKEAFNKIKPSINYEFIKEFGKEQYIDILKKIYRNCYVVNKTVEAVEQAYHMKANPLKKNSKNLEKFLDSVRVASNADIPVNTAYSLRNEFSELEIYELSDQLPDLKESRDSFAISQMLELANIRKKKRIGLETLINIKTLSSKIKKSPKETYAVFGKKILDNYISDLLKLDAHQIESLAETFQKHKNNFGCKSLKLALNLHKKYNYNVADSIKNIFNYDIRSVKEYRTLDRAAYMLDVSLERAIEFYDFKINNNDKEILKKLQLHAKKHKNKFINKRELKMTYAKNEKDVIKTAGAVLYGILLQADVFSGNTIFEHMMDFHSCDGNNKASTIYNQIHKFCVKTLGIQCHKHKYKNNMPQAAPKTQFGNPLALELIVQEENRKVYAEKPRDPDDPLLSDDIMPRYDLYGHLI